MSATVQDWCRDRKWVYIRKFRVFFEVLEWNALRLLNNHAIHKEMVLISYLFPRNALSKMHIVQAASFVEWCRSPSESPNHETQIPFSKPRLDWEMPLQEEKQGDDRTVPLGSKVLEQASLYFEAAASGGHDSDIPQQSQQSASRASVSHQNNSQSETAAPATPSSSSEKGQLLHLPNAHTHAHRTWVCV